MMLGVLVAALGWGNPAAGQTQDEPYWPGAKYDPGIPTLRQVLGHDSNRNYPAAEQGDPRVEAVLRDQPRRQGHVIAFAEDAKLPGVH